MAADGGRKITLYLTSCDAHARSPEGVPMVAGDSFTAPQGYPALPWGCGPLLHISGERPRWLVLTADAVEAMPGGVKIRSGRVVSDGDLSQAARYLHEHGAGGLPYIGRSRKGGDFAILTVGSLGRIESQSSVVGAVGDKSHIQAGAGATVAMGRQSRAEIAEFGRVGGSDGSLIKAGRFSALASGVGSTIETDEGSIVAVASDSKVRAGAGSRVLVESGGAIDLGQRGVGVGSPSTRFRGEEGALFVVVNASQGDESQCAQIRVGEGGAVAGKWYVFRDGSFVVSH